MTIQIIVTIFSALVIAKALAKLYKKEVHGRTVFVWSLFWIIVIFFVWQPNLTNYLAAFLQVTRGADAVFYLSIIVMFYLFFRLFEKLEKTDAEITTLVREVALLKDKKDS